MSCELAVSRVGRGFEMTFCFVSCGGVRLCPERSMVPPRERSGGEVWVRCSVTCLPHCHGTYSSTHAGIISSTCKLQHSTSPALARVVIPNTGPMKDNAYTNPLSACFRKSNPIFKHRGLSLLPSSPRPIPTIGSFFTFPAKSSSTSPRSGRRSSEKQIG